MTRTWKNAVGVAAGVVMLGGAGCGQPLPWEPQPVAGPPASVVEPVVEVAPPVVRPTPAPEPEPEPVPAPPPAVRMPTIAVGDNFAKWMRVNGQPGVAFLCKIRVNANPDQLPIVAELHAGNGDKRPVNLIVRSAEEAVVEYFVPQAGPDGRPYAIQFYAVTGPESREPLGPARDLQWLVAR